MEDFIHETKKYVFTDLGSSLLAIKRGFAKFTIWQTSFRKKLDCNELMLGIMTSESSHVTCKINQSFKFCQC